jgi:hypothetical protein
MPLSIRLHPALEARVEAESRRRGVTKSDVIKDALERVLSLKTPRTLLDQVRTRTPMHRPGASTATGAGLKAKLRAKRSA